MPDFTVPVDEIRVHHVPVTAPDPETAATLAEQMVESDKTTWFHHTEPLLVGDAEPAPRTPLPTPTGTTR